MGKILTLREKNSAVATWQHQICIRGFKSSLLSGRSRGLDVFCQAVDLANYMCFLSKIRLIGVNFILLTQVNGFGRLRKKLENY